MTLAALTLEHVVTIVLIAVGIALIGASWALRSVVTYIQESIISERGAAHTRSEVTRFAQLTLASLLLRVIGILLEASLGLAMGIGLFRPFANYAQLAIPDHTLGVSLLLSVCFFVSICHLISSEIQDALRRLFLQGTDEGA